MMGKWSHLYDHLTGPMMYGDPESYLLATQWTADCALVEDWGCGGGWLRQFIVPPDRYRGIDGSKSPYADIVTDLTTYRSCVPGIVLRYVLEHNYDWARILDNAVTSFTSRLFIALYTSLADETHEIISARDFVPVLSFCLSDITDRLDGCDYTVETIDSRTETIIRVSR